MSILKRYCQMESNKSKPEIKVQDIKVDIKLLKDGRTIFKTHNGFKFFVQDKKGEVTEITEKYYNDAKKHEVKK